MCSRFSKDSSASQARSYYLLKEKNLLLTLCRISPKENDALVAGQLGISARTNDYETHPIHFARNLNPFHCVL